MMVHNFVKYLVQTRLHLWYIKRTNFKPGSCPNDLLEICYFYISQMKSSLEKIFYKIVYHHIIYMCDFLVNLDDFFAIICMGFHEVVVCTRYVPIFGAYSVNHNFMKTRANHSKKKSSKFTKKITHIDDKMIHNFVKYLV